jgi:Tfp pilus assembly protein PilV
MTRTLYIKARNSHGQRGATLLEVVMSVAVAAIGMTGIVGGYIVAARRAEWSACAAAAQAMALEHIELTRAAKWDPMASPSVDELVATNFPMIVQPLDIPVTKTNVILATNTTIITTVTTDPPLRMVRVECVWSLPTRGPFTNSMTSYRSPDQ